LLPRSCDSHGPGEERFSACYELARVRVCSRHRRGSGAPQFSEVGCGTAVTAVPAKRIRNDGDRRARRELSAEELPGLFPGPRHGLPDLLAGHAVVPRTLGPETISANEIPRRSAVGCLGCYNAGALVGDWVDDEGMRGRDWATHPCSSVASRERTIPRLSDEPAQPRDSSLGLATGLPECVVPVSPSIPPCGSESGPSSSAPSAR
jgi:hypothetical protein